jgi:hypothetical protein
MHTPTQFSRKRHFIKVLGAKFLTKGLTFVFADVIFADTVFAVVKGSSREALMP